MKTQIHLRHLLQTTILCAAFVAPQGIAALLPGTVIGWGSQEVPQFAPETRFMRIAAGGAHSLALKFDGTVAAWGNNDWGQSTVPAGLNGISAIAAGYRHSLALKSDGTVVAWGAGGPGQSDNPNYGQSTVPVGLNGVVAIAAGWYHSLALKADGTVVAWGDDLGASPVPKRVNGVIAIAAGSGRSLALKSDGTVVGWGIRSINESGVPDWMKGVVAIATAGTYDLALSHDGTVAVWGTIWNGSEFILATVPVGLKGVVAIAAGFGHSLALKSDGTVVAWGWNEYGQSTVAAGLLGIAGISAGGAHSLALVGTVGHGIDVSHHQGVINWEKVKEAQKLFAFVKATDGLPPDEDDYMEDNVEGANANGILVGVYHVANPDQPHRRAIDEAESFLNYAQQYTGPGFLPPVLDLEQAVVDRFLKARGSTTAAHHELAQWVSTWMGYVADCTCTKPILYIGRDALSHLEAQFSGIPIKDDYLLWITTLDGNDSGTPIYETKDGHLYSWPQWAFKQYAADPAKTGDTSPEAIGRCCDITAGEGYVDLDSFAGTLAQLQRLTYRFPCAPIITSATGMKFLEQGKGLTFQVRGNGRQSIGIQVSTDLASWEDAATIALVNGRGTFSDTASATGKRRFYRIKP
jgi:GH25 family lysozyme M1 (1,4-beta-N-acetylmuramidase)